MDLVGSCDAVSIKHQAVKLTWDDPTPSLFVGVSTSFNMEPIETYPLTLDLTHECDDEADTNIKTSIVSFLTHYTKSPHEVAHNITLAVKPEHNLEGFRNEVEDICIYTSKFLPANHVAQDRLVEIVQAVREVPQAAGQPLWQYIFQDGCSMLIEAEGEKTFHRSRSSLSIVGKQHD